MKCPVCGSSRIGKIIYGLPDFNEELMRQCDNEEVYLGGCIIFTGYPEYHCFACNQNIGSRPVLLKKDKKSFEDIRRLVTGIRFVDDGFPQIFMEKKDNEILLEVHPAADDAQSFYKRAMTDAEWKELLDVLYTKLYLHEWNRVFITRGLPEKGRWELEVNLTEDRVIKYLGLGGFPPYWDEFKAVFKPYYDYANSRPHEFSTPEVGEPNGISTPEVGIKRF